MKFKCDKCDKMFTLKSSLNRHLNTCGSKVDIINQVKELTSENQNIKEQNNILKKQLGDALEREEKLRQDYKNLALTCANKTTNNNNNTITNTTNTINNTSVNLSIFDKTEDDISKLVSDNYDKNYLVEGQKGMAKFTCKFVINNTDKNKAPIYAITDKSRKNGKYKISDDEIVDDQGFSGLGKKIYPPIKQKAIVIMQNENSTFDNEILMSGFNDIMNFDSNNGVFKRCIVEEYK